MGIPRLARLAGVALTAAAGLAATTAAPALAAAPDDHRIVMYYQTHYYSDGSFVSLKPLVDQGTGITDIVVGAIHINDTPGDLHLNDYVPSAPYFDPVWADLDYVKAHGVRVLGMLGGAAPGTFTRLDTDFDTYYPELHDFIAQYGLQGLDLDVEEPMSLAGVERLIDRLRADFGPDFVITLAPVPGALSGGSNLSGFDYVQLYRDRGDDIAWFNTQFYCGNGDLTGTAGYDAIIANGFPASKVVAGTITNADNCGSGYIPFDTVQQVTRELTAMYPDFGGVMGWEYFNSDPDGPAAPWRWAALLRDAMKPAEAVDPPAAGTDAPQSPAQPAATASAPELAATGSDATGAAGAALAAVLLLTGGGLAFAVPRARRRQREKAGAA